MCRYTYHLAGPTSLLRGQRWHRTVKVSHTVCLTGAGPTYVPHYRYVVWLLLRLLRRVVSAWSRIIVIHGFGERWGLQELRMAAMVVAAMVVVAVVVVVVVAVVMIIRECCWSGAR